MTVRTLLMSFVTALLIVTDASAQDISIAKYKGDKQAAVSYTFDDGYLEHFTLVYPQFEKRGIKGTFGINAHKHETMVKGKYSGGKGSYEVCTWDQLSVMARAGHELSNHGWKHLNLRRAESKETRRYDVQHNDTVIYERTGFFPRTFIYPNNAKDDDIVAFCSKDRVGTRTFQVSLGSKRTEQWMNKWVDGLLENGEWGVGMTHGLTNGYDCFGDPTRFWNHLDYAVSLKDRLWIGTFYEVAAYNALRDNVKLDVKAKKRSITVTPAATLDKEIFRSTLTLVVQTDKKITATQDDKALVVEKKNGKSLVDFNPFGDKINIKIEK